jgi:hypothetical protein
MTKSPGQKLSSAHVQDGCLSPTGIAQETKKPDETESGRYSSGQFGQNHFCLAITLSLIFA